MKTNLNEILIMPLYLVKGKMVLENETDIIFCDGDLIKFSL